MSSEKSLPTVEEVMSSFDDDTVSSTFKAVNDFVRSKLDLPDHVHVSAISFGHQDNTKVGIRPQCTMKRVCSGPHKCSWICV